MISIICPVFNEGDYIDQLLSFCTKASPYSKEIIIVDGGSLDNTIQRVNNWIAKYSNIILLHNPKKYVPHALNMGVMRASAEIIIRLDAHTLYDIHYFEAIINAFDKSNAQIVGGPMRIANENSIQAAIGYATSTILGVGNSTFHFENFEGFTQSVYLGAWKKSIFTIVGLFDEEMKRNQDDEFHYRANAKGIKIYQDPSIKSYYFPRKTFKKLFSQYFQYGLYKPLVIKKVNQGFKIRHVVPSLFVLYILACPFFIYFGGLLLLLLYFLLLYFLLIVIFSFVSKAKLMVKLNLLVVYPCVHLAYGLGFLIGLKRIF